MSNALAGTKQVSNLNNNIKDSTLVFKLYGDSFNLTLLDLPCDNGFLSRLISGLTCLFFSFTLGFFALGMPH